METNGIKCMSDGYTPSSDQYLTFFETTLPDAGNDTNLKTIYVEI